MVVMLPLSSMRMYAEPLVVPLEENILDPTLGQGGPQRGPETIPVVSNRTVREVSSLMAGLNVRQVQHWK